MMMEEGSNESEKRLDEESKEASGLDGGAASEGTTWGQALANGDPERKIELFSLLTSLLEKPIDVERYKDKPPRKRASKRSNKKGGSHKSRTRKSSKKKVRPRRSKSEPELKEIKLNVLDEIKEPERQEEEEEQETDHALHDMQVELNYPDYETTTGHLPQMGQDYPSFAASGIIGNPISMPAQVDPTLLGGGSEWDANQFGQLIPHYNLTPEPQLSAMTYDGGPPAFMQHQYQDNISNIQLPTYMPSHNSSPATFGIYSTQMMPLFTSPVLYQAPTAPPHQHQSPPLNSATTTSHVPPPHRFFHMPANPK